MLQQIKQYTKALIPNTVLRLLRPLYHGTVSLLAHLVYGMPSNKLIVIGVTGTNGKSTTVSLLSAILTQAGHKTGFISTVEYSTGLKTNLNTLKMTMPSGWLLHKWLRAMVKNGCHYAVLEISSEGLAQHRHYGINFDIALFTNLTPEHLESHGGFEQYKRAKAILFQSLSHHGLNPAKLAINPGLQKTIVANIDDPYGTYFLNFKAGKHITYGVQNRTANVVPEQVSYDQQGNNFVLHSTRFHLPLKGKFDLYNGLAAIASAGSVGISLDTAKTALEKIAVIPGRVEVLQQKPFTVVIDYAPEPYALAALYDTVAEWQAKRRIHLLGSTGGGRDKARRKILGEMAGSFADIVIVTNEDPYDDDPQEIIDEVASGALGKGKILGTTLFCELDRAKAIAKAVSLAKEDDLVLITGKGSEQKMAIAGGHYIDWDDRKITLDALKRLST